MAYLVSEFKPTPTSRKFDKIKLECKLSGKRLVFHSNILIRLKIAEKMQWNSKTTASSQLFYINNDK